MPPSGGKRLLSAGGARSQGQPGAGGCRCEGTERMGVCTRSELHCTPLGLRNPNPAPPKHPCEDRTGTASWEDGSTQNGAPCLWACLPRTSPMSSPGASLPSTRPFPAPLPPPSGALCLCPPEALVLPGPLCHPSPLGGPGAPTTATLQPGLRLGGAASEAAL